MSKRAGTFVTLDQLIDEVGTDAARFHLLSFSNDSAMTFDIDEVKRRSLENPVYYVQYAHARIESVLRLARSSGVSPPEWNDAPLELLTHESELDLSRALSEFPELVASAAVARSPHRVTRYSEEVAAAFHRFYRDSRIVGDDPRVTSARLALALAARTVIAAALALLGVSAPASMERLAGDSDDAGDAAGEA
jgi:arginyl-tRNA synthetase